MLSSPCRDGGPQRLVPRQVAQEQSTRPEEAIGGRKEAMAAFGRGGRVGPAGGGDVLEVVGAVGLGRLAGVGEVGLGGYLCDLACGHGFWDGWSSNCWCFGALQGWLNTEWRGFR